MPFYSSAAVWGSHLKTFVLPAGAFGENHPACPFKPPGSDSTTNMSFVSRILPYIGIHTYIYILHTHTQTEGLGDAETQKAFTMVIASPFNRISYCVCLLYVVNVQALQS
eukprot:c10042_g1_i1 orf=2-328(-)